MTVHFPANQRNNGGESRQKAELARLSFIQTEVSRAEKIKRSKKVSRIHLNLDGIIVVGRPGREGGRQENYLDSGYDSTEEGGS